MSPQNATALGGAPEFPPSSLCTASAAQTARAFPHTGGKNSGTHYLNTNGRGLIQRQVSKSKKVWGGSAPKGGGVDPRQ